MLNKMRHKSAIIIVYILTFILLICCDGSNSFHIRKIAIKYHHLALIGTSFNDFCNKIAINKIPFKINYENNESIDIYYNSSQKKEVNMNTILSNNDNFSKSIIVYFYLNKRKTFGFYMLTVKSNNLDEIISSNLIWAGY